MKWMALAMLWCVPVFAADWPQYKGPARDGVSPEKGLLTRESNVLWKADVGRGHSSVVVRGERAWTMGWNGAMDWVYCLDARSGAVVWKQSYPSKTIVQWPGPRSTPAVDGEALYTLGQHGQLRAWEAATGKPVWSRDLPKVYEPDADYGFAWSPLAQGDLLILATGSKGLAIDKRTGKTVWGEDGRAGACASAAPFVHEGKAAFAMVSMDASRDFCAIVGVESATGREIFRSPPWKEKWGAACVDVLVDGEHLFITTAEQHKRSGRFTRVGQTLKEDWSTPKLSTYTGNCVLLGGHVYAVNARGLLTCLDWETGEERWSHRGFGEHGNLIAADGKLFVQTGKAGDLVIVEASPKGYRELKRVRVFEDKADTFTAPTLASGVLYCRSYAGRVTALDVR